MSEDPTASGVSTTMSDANLASLNPLRPVPNDGSRLRPSNPTTRQPYSSFPSGALFQYVSDNITTVELPNERWGGSSLVADYSQNHVSAQPEINNDISIIGQPIYSFPYSYLSDPMTIPAGALDQPGQFTGFVTGTTNAPNNVTIMTSGVMIHANGRSYYWTNSEAPRWMDTGDLLTFDEILAGSPVTPKKSPLPQQMDLFD